MAYDIVATLESVVEVLETAGVRAYIDPADVNTPCVWLLPTDLDPGYLCGSGMLTVELYLVVGDAPTIHSITALTDLLEQVTNVLDTDGTFDLGAAVQFPGGGVPLPAYKVTIKVPTI